MTQEVRLISKSGTIHRAFRVGTALYTAEADNMDDMKGAIEFTEDEMHPSSHYCERCFSEDEIEQKEGTDV